MVTQVFHALRNGVLGALVLLLAAGGLAAQKRKNKKPDEEPKPQVLEILPDPPEAIAAETGRLSFQVSPLSASGLLSQQVRDALKALARSNRGATVVKLRAFVAGSGDLRRIKDIVAEEFTDRKQPLPVVSTLQVGALPMTGAQVILEAISAEKRVVNPNGLAFLSASDAPDAAGALKALDSAAGTAGLKGADLLHVTCFLSSLGDASAARTAAAAMFPAAAANFVQMQRLGLEPQVRCEGVGRLESAPGAPFSIRNGAAFVNSPKLVMTATQLVFRDQDSDFRLAYQRLGKSMSAVGAGMQDVLWAGAYALTRPGAAKLDAIEREFLDSSRPPARTAVQIEGLPSSDATAAIELIAVAH